MFSLLSKGVFAKFILALQRARLGSPESYSPENLLHLIMTSYLSRKTFNKDCLNSLPIFTIEQSTPTEIEPKPALQAGFARFTENARLVDVCRRQFKDHPVSRRMTEDGSS
jgi:hypothetical protein